MWPYRHVFRAARYVTHAVPRRAAPRRATPRHATRHAAGTHSRIVRDVVGRPHIDTALPHSLPLALPPPPSPYLPPSPPAYVRWTY